MCEYVAKGASAIEAKQRFRDIALYEPPVARLFLFWLAFLDLPCVNAAQISIHFWWYFAICIVSDVIYPLVNFSSLVLAQFQTIL